MSTVTHLVVTDNFAGVERYITSVARLTAERGWTVRVLGGRAAEMQRELPAGVAWAPAPTLAAAVPALLRSPKADVLHLHMTSAEVAGAIVRRGRAVVSTCHFAAPRGSSSLARVVAGLAVRHVDRQLAISEFVRQRVEDPAVQVLLSGVPVTACRREPARTVVVAQRWEAEKQTVDAVRAFAQSGIAADGWTLDLYGDGGERERIHDAIARAGLGASVRLRGWAEDMTPVFVNAGIFLAPAPLEGFGLSVVEAMAAGVPVLAAGGGGHLETVGSAAVSRLFRPGDVEDCARQLVALARQPSADRETYGEALRTHQRANLDLSGHVDGLLEHYAELLATR